MAHHVVVVGGGFGGLETARRLERDDVKVTLIDRQNYHLFQPLLYQVATAGLSPGDIASPIRNLVASRPNVEVRMGDVVGVDLANKRVKLADGELSYDSLVLAAGVRHSYFGKSQWEGDAPGLKTLDDALEIRRRVLLAFENAEREDDPVKRAGWLTFVVVGGGPTGVELAGAISELARFTVAKDFRRFDPRTAKVVLVEAGPRVLAAFDTGLSGKARASLEKLQVDVRLQTRVQDVTSEGVQLPDGFLPAKTVLWAAGVEAPPLSKTLGVETDRSGRIKVQPDLSIPNHPNAYVIGDLAWFPLPDGSSLPGLAPVALQQGITSTLDVALRLRSELVGALCIEHRGPPRRWSAAEEVFSSALADVVALALETTERRRIENALTLSERRFKDIFRYSSDNILLYRVAVDGRVFCEDINPAVEQSTGYRRDDVVGREAHEVVPPLAAARLNERYQQAIRARLPIIYEHELPLATGPRVYNTAIIPMLDDTGRVQRLASVARDVTTQRLTERLSRQLETQLAEAQKNEALARLATHVAHDVGSLLSAVDAHAQRLADGTAAPEAQRAILEATARGRELARRIANYGRRRPDEKRPVDLKPLVDEVLRQLSATAPAVDVVRSLFDVRVPGDSVQLHQVLLNLCTNALQSMPDGGTLTVSLELARISFDQAATRPPLRAGSFARLVVSDTGPGMDEATRRRIFEPYYSTSTARSGLGLAVVQSVVTGHDGAVFATSTPGAGSTFEVFLPAVDADDDQPGEGQHLMLVDDHPGMARVSAKLLETLGYRTTVFDDPRAALEAFRQKPQGFDAVLTDLSMPQMSGEEFTRSLRAVRPTLPVIVSSGFASHLDKEELGRLGVAAVLLKPWKLDEAVATLKRVLSAPR